MFTSKTKVLLILTQDVLDYGGGGRGLTFPNVPKPRGEIRWTVSNGTGVQRCSWSLRRLCVMGWMDASFC